MNSHYELEAIMDEDGSLYIQNLPFRKGDKVSVRIFLLSGKSEDKKYPLRGKPIRYPKPFEPVAENDWDVLT